MGLNDSPIYRGSQDLTRTLLDIARLRQAQKEHADQEAARQRALSLEEDKAFQGKVDRSRDDMFRRGLGEIVNAGRPLEFQSAAPDPTGDAPLMPSGYGESQAIRKKPGIDGYDLLSLIAQTKPEMMIDAHTQPFLQQSGVVSSPEAIKLAAQASDRANRPGIATAIRAFNPSVGQDDAATIARDVPTSELSSIMPLGIRQQVADTGAEKVRAIIEDLLATRPARIESKMAGADANRERAATERDMRPGKVTGQGLTNEGKGLDNTAKREGKSTKPSEQDKDVDALAEHYLTSPEFADAPEQRGMFSNTPAVSRSAAAHADVIAEDNEVMKRLKFRAWQKAFGGKQGGASAPAATKKVLRFDNQGNLLQ